MPPDPYGDWFWPNISGSESKRYFVKWKQAGKRELKELRKLVAAA